MSSDHRKPIVTEAESRLWVAPLPDDKKPIAKNTKLCVYCGSYHGSENRAFRCLEDGVKALRAELATLKNVSRLERAGKEPEKPGDAPSARPKETP